MSASMLRFVSDALAAGAEPWTSALAAAARSPYGSLAYQPHPRAVVACGSSSRPDEGCSDERHDAAAAYTHALLWWYRGDHRHAEKAAEILEAWSSTLVAHTLSNAPLQAAWVAAVLPRAAELLRARDPAFTPARERRVAEMLRTRFLPLIAGGSAANGNWELSMIDATMAIAVFTDDPATFARAVAMWRARVPAYVYLRADGEPRPPPGRASWDAREQRAFWHEPVAWSDGLTQETCRDLGHVQDGLAAMMNAGLTAAIQGVPLLDEAQARLRAAWELLANLRAEPSRATALCGRPIDTRAPEPTGELALEALGSSQLQAMPALAAWVRGRRPLGVSHHMVWETLTHADVPWRREP